ncbi:glycosyltransferase, partial [Bacillus cereus]|nr:glycosyltransferase [Bacillus cereus]
LIAFHLGRMQIINTNEFEISKQETLELHTAVLDYIYIPYIEQLNKTCHTLHNTFQKSPSSLFADQIDTTTIKNYFKYPSPHHN